MRRFVVRFLIGSVAMLIAYELVQAVAYHEDEDGYAPWYLAGATHMLLADAHEHAPPPRTPAELEARLGVPVAAITEADWRDAQERALLTSTQDDIELVVLPMTEGEWRVVARVPAGPVSIDAWALDEEHDTSVDVAHLLSLLVLALGMAGVGLALVTPPARQLRRLAQTARALQDGDLTARTEVPPGGLVAPVARTFNAMAEQLQRILGWQELMLQTVAHELRTPLARVRFVAQRVADASDDVERADALATLDLDLTELEDLVSSVLSLVRAAPGSPLERVPVDVGALVRETLDRFARVHPTPGLTLECDAITGRGAWAAVNRAAAIRVLDNLLRNAVAHASGRVRVTVEPEDATVLIAVEDDGDGLPEASRGLAVAPFVRLDEGRARTGTGLGLAIVKGLVEAQQVHQSGLEVVDVDFVLGDSKSEFVGFSVRETAFHATAGHPHGEAIGVMIAA